MAAGHHLAMLCPTNEIAEEAKDDFYDQLQMVLEQVPCKDVKIVMADINVKVGMDNTGREEVMGKHGARAEINENGERWAHFCQANELVIGGTLFPHKECHKRTWRSADGVIVNQIDHLAFSKRWRRQIEQGYVETCEQVLGRAQANRKE